MTKILCFGDSNTYGYIPGGLGRFDGRTRWTGCLQRELGEGWEVMEEGLNGRTTVFLEEECPERTGLPAMGEAMKQYHPDILILMLGTNDCKRRFKASPEEIAGGLEEVLKRALESARKPFQVLLAAPILIAGGFEPGAEFDEDSVQKSRELSGVYRKLAEKYSCEFLDASQVAAPSPVDLVHLDAEGHATLGHAMAGKIREMKQKLYLAEFS